MLNRLQRWVNWVVCDCPVSNRTYEDNVPAEGWHKTTCPHCGRQWHHHMSLAIRVK